MRRDDFLHPCKTVFFYPPAAARTMIVKIDVNKTVTFTHLTAGAADDIQRSPDIVSAQIDAVRDRCFHRFDVFTIEIHTLRIMNVSVRIQGIDQSDAVFRNINWTLIAVIEHI